MNRTITTGLAALTLLGAAVVARGQAPPAGHSAVRDHAHMFSPEAVKKAEAALENFRSATRFQVVVETVESVGEKGEKTAAIDNAKALQVHGLYVLIDKKKHGLTLEPSDSARAEFPETSRKAIYETVVKAFKAKDFDKGLADAVALIRKEHGLSPEFTPKAAPPAPAPAERTSDAPAVVPKTVENDPTGGGPAAPAPSSGGFPVTLVVIGAVVLFMLWAVSRMFRRPQQVVYGQPASPNYGPRPQPGYGPQGGYAPPQPGYAPQQPGYGYGPPPAQGGGGGFMSGALGGLGGAVLGNVLYDKFGRPQHDGGAVHQEGGVMPTHQDPAGGSGGGWGSADAPATPQETYDPNNAVSGNWDDPASGGGAPADDGSAGGDWGGGADQGQSGGDWGGNTDDQGDGGGGWVDDPGAGTDPNAQQGGDW